MTSGLFDDLAVQAAPEREGGGRPRLRTAERRQVELRAVSLDALVPADQRVRLVWRFVEGLELSALMAQIKAIKGRPGHPPADPRILMALWLFATIEGIGSARAQARRRAGAQARRCADSLPFQGLCRGVGMNHKTLSDFRTGHGAAEDRERQVENALAATAELRAMQEEKARKRAGQASDDAGSDGDRPDGGGKAAAKPGEKEPRVSTTDAEAGVMKMADGGFARLGDITALARAGVTAFVPVPTPRDKTRDRFAPRPDDPPEVAAWRRRMARYEAREICKERAATVECVNAQARNRGLTRFLVRGMDKVKAVALWRALAHNMACGWRLLPA